MYAIHIKKVIAKLYSFTLRRKKWQKVIGQKFRLTPGCRKLLNRTFWRPSLRFTDASL